MNQPNIWKEKYNIHSYDADFLAKCKLTSILQFFQDVAWKQAESLSFGYTDLLKQGKFWALSGLVIEILEYPNWGDIVQVNTWPKGIDSLLALRDFEIYKDSKLLCKSASSWLVLDLKTRRPQKVEQVFTNFNSYCNKQAIDYKFRRINIPEVIDYKHSIQVKYSDVDVNSHVNNVKYVEWALNCLSPDIFEKREIKRIEINFLSECGFGDEIKIGY
ncbi:MAG: hypothetical protein JXB17_00015, partial [Bacteroidales bacterium]|nr:hypothetical protein [Bacteroidales bacterium]